MPIQNLGRTLQGNAYVDSRVTAPTWRPFPRLTFPAGSDQYQEVLLGYLDGDVESIAGVGSFTGEVFSLSGTNPNKILSVTPRASVSQNTVDSIVLRATGQPIGALTPTADQTYYVTTIAEGVERVFWAGNPGRAFNENTSNNIIGLSQFVQGLPDNSFDSITLIEKSPDVDWITLLNGDSTMAQLRVAAPSVNINTHIQVTLRVTRDTASPKTDDITFTITVLDIDTVDENEGINVVRWDMPNAPINEGVFTVSLLLDAPLQQGDSLDSNDFYIDGVPTGQNGVRILSVAVDRDNNKRYILSCRASHSVNGIATFGLNRS